MKDGRSPSGRAGALRAEPATQSQAEPLVPNATVFAAAAYGENRRTGETYLCARISFLSAEDALGKALLNIEAEGCRVVLHHEWWEDFPASGIVAATAGETEGLDERSEQSPVGVSRDAQSAQGEQP